MQRGRTGIGHVYYRDRSNGDDVTVYEHQLMALLNHDPFEVFDPCTDVHHVAPAPDANVPWLLTVEQSGQHRARNLPTVGPNRC